MRFVVKFVMPAFYSVFRPMHIPTPAVYRFYGVSESSPLATASRMIYCISRGFCQQSTILCLPSTISDYDAGALSFTAFVFDKASSTLTSESIATAGVMTGG